MNKRYLPIFLFLILFPGALLSFAGRLRPKGLPFVPKWGALVMAVPALVFTVLASKARPRMKRASAAKEAALRLLSYILAEDDLVAEIDISNEYHHRRRQLRTWRWLYGLSTACATVFGVWCGSELFNWWYWSLRRCRRLEQKYPVKYRGLYARARHIKGVNALYQPGADEEWRVLGREFDL